MVPKIGAAFLYPKPCVWPEFWNPNGPSCVSVGAPETPAWCVLWAKIEDPHVGCKGILDLDCGHLLRVRIRAIRQARPKQRKGPLHLAVQKLNMQYIPNGNCSGTLTPMVLGTALRP